MMSGGRKVGQEGLEKIEEDGVEVVPMMKGGGKKKKGKQGTLGRVRRANSKKMRRTCQEKIAWGRGLKGGAG